VDSVTERCFDQSLEERKEVIQEEVKQKQPDCSYCYKNYKSTECLFYEKYDCVFKKQMYRFSKSENCEKPINCLCCDYTTEEEDEEDNVPGGNDEDSTPPPDKMLKTSGEQEEKKIQPGWFGKGYRKYKKYKRRISNQY